MQSPQSQRAPADERRGGLDSPLQMPWLSSMNLGFFCFLEAKKADQHSGTTALTKIRCLSVMTSVYTLANRETSPKIFFYMNQLRKKSFFSKFIDRALGFQPGNFSSLAELRVMNFYEEEEYTKGRVPPHSRNYSKPQVEAASYQFPSGFRIVRMAKKQLFL